MPIKTDSEHVVHFTFVPVGIFKNTCNGRYGVAVVQRYFEANEAVAFKRKKMVNNRKVFCRKGFPFVAVALIDTTYVVKKVEGLLRAFEVTDNRHDFIFRYPQRKDIIDGNLLPTNVFSKA